MSFCFLLGCSWESRSSIFLFFLENCVEFSSYKNDDDDDDDDDDDGNDDDKRVDFLFFGDIELSESLQFSVSILTSWLLLLLLLLSINN